MLLKHLYGERWAADSRHPDCILQMPGVTSNRNGVGAGATVKNVYKVCCLYVPDNAGHKPVCVPGGCAGNAQQLCHFTEDSLVLVTVMQHGLVGGALMPRHVDMCCSAVLCCAGRRTKIKCRVETISGSWVEKIPAWIKWATQVRVPGWGGYWTWAWEMGGRAQLVFESLYSGQKRTE
jgi:hypothetical protein